MLAWENVCTGKWPRLRAFLSDDKFLVSARSSILQFSLQDRRKDKQINLPGALIGFFKIQVLGRFIASLMLAIKML